MTILPKKKVTVNKESRSAACSSSNQCHGCAASSGGSNGVIAGGCAAVVDHLPGGDSLMSPTLGGISSAAGGVVAGHRRHFSDKSAACVGMPLITGASDADPVTSSIIGAGIGNATASFSSMHRSKRCKTRASSSIGGATVALASLDRSTVGLSSPALHVGSNEELGGVDIGGGCNSEDEYEKSAKGTEYSDEMERKFEDKMKKAKGYNIKRMKEDGACLFRAVADQVYGDQEMHGAVRKLCMDYMAKNSDHFSQFVTEDFAMYVARKRLDTSHGNHAEIQALAEIFSRPVEVYQYSLEPINIFYTNSLSKCDASAAPIRVAYHRNIHYNSLVDPFAATIGVGLGLPQFHPGSADKNLVQDAETASERDEIERAMLKDKLMATDWEATDEQIQEQIARESYLEWIRSQEKKMKENVSLNRGESTVTRPHKPRSPAYNFTRSSKPASPAHENTVHSDISTETAGPSHRSSAQQNEAQNSKLLEDMSPSLFGISQYEDDSDMINKVLALSQQEYFDSLKK